MAVQSDPCYAPLSSSQQNIWGLECLSSRSTINHICATLTLRGHVDPELLADCLAQVLEGDATLRTRITLEGNTPVQYQVPYQPEAFPLLSLTGEEADRWTAEFVRTPMAALDGPLYRFALLAVGEGELRLVMKLHHLISDGWTQTQLSRRVGQLYLDRLDGQASTLPPIPNYLDHLAEERAYLASPAYRRDLDYWTGLAPQLDHPTSLKTPEHRADLEGARRTFRLDPQVEARAATFCTGHGISLFTLFTMALAIYTAHAGGEDRCTIGVPVSNRRTLTDRASSGMFVSTLPSSFPVEGDWSLEELTEHTRACWTDLLRHQRLPLSQIAPNGVQPFHVALSYLDQRSLVGHHPRVTCSGQWHYSGCQMEQLCIHLNHLEEGGGLTLHYDYRPQYFEPWEMDALHASLTHILVQALAHPQRPIRDLSLTEEGAVPTPTAPTGELWAKFQDQTDRRPREVALLTQHGQVTFAELAIWSARFHAALAPLRPQADDLVAILLPRSPQLLAAMVGVLRAGCGFLLLSPDLPQGRVRDILTQSGPAALIAPVGAVTCPGLPQVDSEALPGPTPLPPAARTGSDLAYVVYTSGSTGSPKGVEISREALANLVEAMEPLQGEGPVLSVCPVGFDAFLLESIVPLFQGRAVLLPTQEALDDPAALAALLDERGAGFLAVTPSRLAAWLTEPAFGRALAGLETIVCGGEDLPLPLLGQLQQLTQARIYNQYGPSETTVAVSLKELTHATTVTAGDPMANCRLYVLDRWGRPLPRGVEGQLYVGGRCVGRGYRKDPALTAKVFLPAPFVPGGTMYATGDLARMTPEGELVLVGRADGQIKLHGLRIEPREIAACLERHPQVHRAAVVLQGELLAAFYTAQAPIPDGALRGLVVRQLPQYMVPGIFQYLDAFPLTPSGKVDTKGLPLLSPTRDRTAGETPTQTAILAVFRQTLEDPELGIDQNYFLAGGTSLRAMETAARITQVTGHRLRPADLFACPTARQLAELVDRGTLPAQPVAPAPRRERWPITPIQQGIYVQSSRDPAGRTYQMAAAFRLAQPPHRDRLEGAFRQLIAGEPLLRTAFLQEEDGVFAHVRQTVPFTLPILRGDTLEDAAAPLLHPFSLALPPLLRAGLWEEAPGRWVLLVNLHHMVGDGLSTPILLDRLDRLYRGETLPAAPLSFLDYACRREQPSPAALDHWVKALTPLPPPLELPGDFPRSQEADFQGDTRVYPLSPLLSRACNTFCREMGITPYVLFLGVFGLVMARLGGRDSLLVGTPVSGRLSPETLEMCGPFLNTLPLLLEPRGELTVVHYLTDLQDQIRSMLDHQQAGLEEIAAALKLPRTLSQSPLFQVIFSQRPVDPRSFHLDGQPMESLPLPTGAARMDLWMELFQDGEGYALQTEYARRLFLPETVDYFTRCVETTALWMTHHPHHPLDQTELLAPRDRLRLLDAPQNQTVPFDPTPLPLLIRQRMEEDPQAPAVLFHGQVTTRGELDRRACQIANLLVRAGARPGCRVGIALRRRVDLIAGVLAVWKVGGAYAPLLAHYPEQRLSYMCRIAGLSHILCDGDTAQQLPAALPSALVRVEEEAGDTFPAHPLQEGDLAEVLFTSGSTGQPKGVMLAWRSLGNMAQDFRRLLSSSAGPILCTTNVVFDMFNGEVVIPLTMGKPIVLADEEEMMLPWKLASLIRRDGVTITQSTPSRVQMWLTNRSFRQAAAQLEAMIYGGEVLTSALLSAAREAAPRAAQINVYGPTEGTVYNTTRTTAPGEPINVGWPMANNRVYVLDGDLRPLPPTAVGDLYLAGECVSLGYIGRPDLTDAAFLPDPFFPGQRMYRTGDVGRLRLDGSYDFLGRRDAQVKLNGQRVELDEINGALVSTGCARLAATVPLTREDGSMALCTYYIPGAEALSHRAIRAKLAQVLPHYMVPAQLVAMSDLPRTPTGKLDLRRLKEMAEQAAPEQTRKEGVPLWLLDLWRRALGRPDVDPDLSFFDQGGTSLAALNLLSQYHNRGLAMEMGQFYAAPTPREQAELLSGNTPPAPPPLTLPFVGSHLSKVPPLPPLDAGPMDTVLLTGATGFFGAHLLRELLESGTQRVLCTMRDGDRGRLLDSLRWYFGPWADQIAPRLEVVRADLSQPGLGLEGDLPCPVQAIWHCGSDVRHFAADEDRVLATNVGGTYALLALAQRDHIPFYHISTTSVAGRRLAGHEDRATFTERDLDLGQDWRDNIYVRSKFLAEEAVFEAIQAGLPARVFRLGRLVGRTGDGRFQRTPQNNVFWHMVRGIAALGAIPEQEAHHPLDLTPVDWCARAVLALAHSPAPVYHLQFPASPTTAEALTALIPHLQVVDGVTFQLLLDQSPPVLGERIALLSRLWDQALHAPITITVEDGATRALLDAVGFREEVPGPEVLLRGVGATIERSDLP